jgi:hypothetical protein
MTPTNPPQYSIDRPTKYRGLFYFGSYSKPGAFAHSEIIPEPKMEISIISPAQNGKRWIYRLEQVVTMDYEGNPLRIPEAVYRFVEER